MIQRILMTVAAAGLTTAIVTAASPAFSTASLAMQAPSKSTNSGVYTTTQGERGQKVFEAKCTACHDTSRFTGEAFLESWVDKSMKEVWDIASGTMPEDNPGSLKQQEYARHPRVFPVAEHVCDGRHRAAGQCVSDGDDQDRQEEVNSRPRRRARRHWVAAVVPWVAGGDQEMKSVKAGVYTRRAGGSRHRAISRRSARAATRRIDLPTTCST